MKRLCVLPVLLLASLALQATETQSAPEADEAKVVRLTSHLENHPLSDTDKSIRSWLLQWATETQDITVVVCNILGTASGEDLPYSAIYTTQMIFGNTAYQIAHPDKREDLLATQLAAARSSLNAYNSILDSHPEARIPYLDELTSKDRSGSLESYLAPVIAEKCDDSGGT
ncbi:hypothetical protein LDO26_06730 [Luteimonas sp. BDR2-5]|uniref:hypothetical protein n=1 Tax=Proluteimonas luteida TaxID=2878685 RepID=UPI001E4B74F4|nr:hypothetical protein [Luteimonas sp. BDR2-5]MCD9027899.1 hypothetical protein [Luteimonas sp. BDR2-5]